MKSAVASLWSMSLLLTSCERMFCSERLDINSSALLIHPFDTRTDKYFYQIPGLVSVYNQDSLQVFNDDGQRVKLVIFLLEVDPRNKNNSYYPVKISPAFFIPQDNSAYDLEKTKKMYLKYNP